MKIAFIGTGILGRPMAEKLLEAGHELRVYNRTAAKAEALKEKGALLCAAPEEAIRDSEAVVLVLADGKAIDAVLFQDEKALANKTVIQMGTIGPEESRRLMGRLKKLSCDYMECPVLGSKNEAQNAQLILMAGGRVEQFEKFLPVLKCFGPKPRLVGEIGQAAALKLALNQLIASHAAGFALSLGIVQKNKVDVDTFMGILSESALFAPMFSKKLPHWLSRDYTNANFPLRHLLKDVNLILDEAREKKLNVSVLSAVKEVLAAGIDQGLEDADYSAVYETINKK